jgi:hypothetical protein
MLAKLAGPDFDRVLVRQAGAPPLATSALIAACAEVWPDFCTRSGVVDNTTNFGIYLNKWGGTTISPARLTIGGKRVTGYSGICILGAD